MIEEHKLDRSPIDIQKYRQDFPALHQEIYGYPLVYLDNAATTQKPKQVLDALSQYYAYDNSNVHRGVHHLSQKATDQFEQARITIQQFLNAKHEHEIVFTKGTTEGINLVAATFGRTFLKPGDAVIISALEHHSNIVPWQLICDQQDAELRVIPMNDRGELILEEFGKMLDEKVKIVSVGYVSNALGTVNPVREIIQRAHQFDIPVLLDAAQAVQHIPIDVQDLDVDFLVFSSHKIFGPTGMGVLYGKEKWLDIMPPYQGGGEMIETVTFEKTTFNKLPFKFEAGTPHIAGAIGLDIALRYVRKIELKKIHAYENELLEYAISELATIEGLKFIGEAQHRAGAISFLLDGIHPFDTGEILDKMGIAVRTGHHCTEPIMGFFQIPGTVRASFSFYNNRADVDRLKEGILKAQKMLL